MPKFKSMKREAIKEPYNIFSYILQNSNEYITIVDEKFQIEYINEKMYLKGLGYSKADLIGKLFTQIIHPDDKKLILNLIVKNLEQNEINLKLKIKHKDGNWKLFNVKGKAFSNSNSKVETIFFLEQVNENKEIGKKINKMEEKIDIDLNKKKKNSNDLINSEQRYHILIENLPFSIVLLDSKGMIKEVNNTTTKLLGYSREELIDSSLSNFSITLKENFHFFLDHFKVNKENSELLVLDVQFKRKDKDMIWINMHSSVVIVNDELLIQVMLYNISERKRAEELIREEIDKLKELEKIRRDLVSSVSHELKTPLMTISGASELLLEVFTSNVNDEALDLVKMIERGSRRLASLIERFFDISRLELNALNLENKECNLSVVIEVCSNELKYLLKRREIVLNLNLEPDVLLEVDKLRIEQIIMNLLSNAIKNTPPKGRIDISLKKNGVWAEVKIKDTGIGLTTQELKKLKNFTRFTKLERQGPGTEYLNIQGTGLGLFISKAIVDLYKGEMEVKSEGRDEGSSFIIKLPIYSK